MLVLQSYRFPINLYIFKGERKRIQSLFIFSLLFTFFGAILKENIKIENHKTFDTKFISEFFKTNEMQHFNLFPYPCFPILLIEPLKSPLAFTNMFLASLGGYKPARSYPSWTDPNC